MMLPTLSTLKTAVLLLPLAIPTAALALPQTAVWRLADAQNHQHQNHQHQSGAGHSHGSLAVPTGTPQPTVNLVVERDRKSGWNLRLTTTNFQFAPEELDKTNRVDSGHAHLFLNGKKIARLYGPWYHLASLPAGKQTLMVELTSNQHNVITVNGQPVIAKVTVDVPAMK
ncbi:hypothetical protein [Synechococcus elongatus]|uniref:Uncharacterized protein n=2 Tax=Synechococcus elongatus TaxID=32046 RepID=Q31MQ7_SYNE7|nr:hypothetical protein [Synechococcus elongatus]ABB57662.1 conserved hypothetical protein [Synechococcus elongatus PCC 7942 = FACHB-805]AJD58002.1 hypothetical protein M744_09240 [Synechococcus elongatus UTEX 2973]MBD2588470.1 hypothetical protein [Synechococcus elongatus FACHB-242]MBD2689367.1 hypothetical protein [Synechococcus elongatus FACHB-1061]MBD2708214.1 hypothetical protein [Synechococcus elongatus PCC 7942 = FACHB-805]